MMMWSYEQSQALDAVGAWLRNPQGAQVFRLFGYAGTGKTTLAQHLAAQQDGTTLFAAYTGKAASVLRERGCANATTLHSLIYLPVDIGIEGLYMLNDTEVSYKPRFILNPESELKYAKLLIIDEVSMVDEAIARDVLSFGKRVLVLGDPAQLPPVSGAGYFTNATPDIMLTEIHRQARDNPIIHVATLARNGKIIPMGGYGDAVRKVWGDKVEPAYYGSEYAGQILCGKNRTRRAINDTVRTIKGIASHKYPRNGDTLVCLRNNHMLGLLNGTIWTAHMDAVHFPKTGHIGLNVRQDRNIVYDLLVDGAPFRGKDPDPMRHNLAAFDYGYAITVHKAQGSQWDTVTLYDDGFGKMDATLRRQWLYTGITRAAKQLNIIVPL